MSIWYLILWGVLVPPFEGGQYQSKERCEEAAAYQVVALRSVYGMGELQWKCELRVG